MAGIYINQGGKAVAVAGVSASVAKSPEDAFDPSVYNLPILALTGDTSAMTKDNAVTLDYEYGDRSGSCTVKWQGNSSLAYPKKNYTIKFDNAFEAAAGWGEQMKYCLKANFIDFSHARNVVSAKLWGQIVKKRSFAMADTFDINKCGGVYNLNDELVAGTEPVDGVITTTWTLYTQGLSYLGGYTFEQGAVYKIGVDVYITDTAETNAVYFGFYDTDTDTGKYFQSAPVNTNGWQHVEMAVSCVYKAGRLMVMLERGTSMQMKNICVTREGESCFELAAVTGFIDGANNDMSNYFSISGNRLNANLSSYNNRGYMVGPTFPKGSYKLRFTVRSNGSETVDPELAVCYGFGKDGTECSGSCALSARQSWEYIEVVCENPVDDGYLYIQPLGGPTASNNNSMQYMIENITVVASAGASDSAPSTGGSSLSQLMTLPNGGAIDGFPCIIMLNGKFHGLYTWNIPKDGWMMGMGAGTQEAILCADYSDASRFAGPATLDGDFDLEYVTNEDDTAWVLESVNRMIAAVMDSDGTDLDTTIAQYLDWDSAIDYMIFRNLLNGIDMGGKNYILATYDGTEWFFSAYDMDCVYGLDWDGKKFYSATGGFNAAHAVDKLILTYKKDVLKARYRELRNGVMSDANVAYMFTNFIGQIPMTVYAEDAKTWPSIPNTSANNLSQIVSYYKEKAAQMDVAVESL